MGAILGRPARHAGDAVPGDRYRRRLDRCVRNVNRSAGFERCAWRV